MVCRTISHYEITETLGEGGMGVVYKARDTRLGRTVALKFVNAAFTNRFEREAKAISTLNHPHICTLYDVGEHEGTPYLVMEYVEGKPLKGPLPANEALPFAIQAGEALAAAHKAGITHRDLKPDNILLTTEGSVKVLDFGLAKLQPNLAVDASTVTMTEQGVVAGTAPYMSPEQAKGEPVDARSDIFSLGAVLYEVLSGRRAFRGETMGATLAAVITSEPPPLKEAPAEVARIVGKMLAKKREARYQSAEELLVDLRAVATGAARASRRRWLALTAALVIVVGVAAGFDVRALRTRLITWMRAPAPSIRLAVLPFANLSGDPEQEYLSDGLTQEMITQLGRLHPERLSVIARTSVMRYKKSDKPVDQVGRELGVDYILEGSARREAGWVRITAELIQVRSQTQLWAESFERELEGILALQSEVAKKVAGSLALKLLPAEQARLANARAVTPEAYDAYLKGLHHWYKLTPGDLESAQRYFELALAKDPNYALAHAGMSTVWAARQQMGITPPGEAAPKVKEAALKAVALDETAAEAHLALAGVKTFIDWDWAGAEREFKRAIEINPGSPDAQAGYSNFLMIMGRLEEAMPLIERALQLDPFNAYFQGLYGAGLLWARRYDDVIGQCRKTLRMAPDNPVVLSMLSWACFLKQMYKEGVAAERALFSGDREIEEAIDRGYAEEGYAGALRREAQVLGARSRNTYVSPWLIACAYFQAGDKALALDWFERALEERDPNMPCIGSPFFDGLRGEPRYQAILRRMKLPQ